MSDLRPYTIYLDPDERDRLKREAREHGRDGLSVEVRHILDRRRAAGGKDFENLARYTAMQIRATLSNGGPIIGATLVMWARGLDDRDGAPYSSDDDRYFNRSYERRT